MLLDKLLKKTPMIELNSYPFMYTDVRDDDYRIVCPTCGREVDEFDNERKCKCGQRLDWRKFYEWCK